jgi:hypothetical protein
MIKMLMVMVIMFRIVEKGSCWQGEYLCNNDRLRMAGFLLDDDCDHTVRRLGRSMIITTTTARLSASVWL